MWNVAWVWRQNLQERQSVWHLNVKMDGADHQETFLKLNSHFIFQGIECYKHTDKTKGFMEFHPCCEWTRYSFCIHPDVTHWFLVWRFKAFPLHHHLGFWRQIGLHFDDRLQLGWIHWWNLTENLRSCCGSNVPITS